VIDITENSFNGGEFTIEFYDDTGSLLGTASTASDEKAGFELAAGETTYARVIIDTATSSGTTMTGSVSITGDADTSVALTGTADSLSATGLSSAWTATNTYADEVISDPENDRVYVAWLEVESGIAQSSKLLALDAGTGSTAWENTTDYSSSNTINSIAVSPDWSTVYVAQGGTFLAHNSSNGNKLFDSDSVSNDSNIGNMIRITAGPNGNTVYGVGYDGSVVAFDASDGSITWSNTSIFSNYVQDVAVSPGGTTVYAAGDSPQVASFDAGTGNNNWTNTTTHSDWGQAVSVAPDGNTVYTGSNDKSVAALDPSDGSKNWQNSSPYTSGIRTIAVSADGNSLYTGEWDNVITALDASNGGEDYSQGTPDTPQDISVSELGYSLYVAADTDTVKYNLDGV
jgi:outer membrane protein assembly factor BamB